MTGEKRYNTIDEIPEWGREAGSVNILSQI